MINTIFALKFLRLPLLFVLICHCFYKMAPTVKSYLYFFSTSQTFFSWNIIFNKTATMTKVLSFKSLKFSCLKKQSVIKLIGSWNIKTEKQSVNECYQTLRDFSNFLSATSIVGWVCAFSEVFPQHLIEKKILWIASK